MVREAESSGSVSSNSNMTILEHKVDLLLRLTGLTPDQIRHIVEAKDAPGAQQALIDKFVSDNAAAKSQPVKPT